MRQQYRGENMKNILKNYNYLSMIIAFTLSVLIFGSLFFIQDRTYFTVVFIVQILMNFLVTSVLMLGNLENNSKFKYIIIYLLSTFVLLLLNVVVICNRWDTTIYSNLMYITNIQLYLLIYFSFVFAMVLLMGYAFMKSYQKKEKKSSIRQKSAKQ